MHRQSLRRQKSTMEMQLLESLGKNLADTSLEKRQLEESQRKRKEEIDKLKESSKKAADEMDNLLGQYFLVANFLKVFLDAILDRAERVMSFWSPEKVASSTQTPVTRRRRGFYNLFFTFFSIKF